MVKKNLASKQYIFTHFQTVKERILRAVKTQQKLENQILIKGKNKCYFVELRSFSIHFLLEFTDPSFIIYCSNRYPVNAQLVNSVGYMTFESHPGIKSREKEVST